MRARGALIKLLLLYLQNCQRPNTEQPWILLKSGWSGLQEQIKENGVRGTKSRIREEAKDTPLSAAQISSQVILHISKTKGDEASPLVKAFVRAAEKLTDEEYNCVQCAVKPMMAAIDAVVKEQAIAKPNPFRQKTPGKTG
jgi:hypothetical protein